MTKTARHANFPKSNLPGSSTLNSLQRAIDAVATCCFAVGHLPTAASARRTARHTSRLYQFAGNPLSHSLPPPLWPKTTVAAAARLAITRGSNAAAVGLGVEC